MVRGSKKCYQKLLNFITEVYILKTDKFFTPCPKRSNSGERREMENGKGKRTYKVLYSLKELSIWFRDVLITTNLTTAH